MGICYFFLCLQLYRFTSMSSECTSGLVQVMKLKNFIFQAWKVMEVNCWSWKVMENLSYVR